MSQKTTIYLTDEQKRGVAREAQRRQCSEAEVIRNAIDRVVRRPTPHAGILDAEPFADRIDELMDGFGNR